MSTQRYAVVDIGTLKVKCQVAEKNTKGELSTIYQSNNLTCLGCHMEQNNNKPKEENLTKLLVELKRCKLILDKYNVTKKRIVSTHALREMGKTGQDIAKLIKSEVGFKVEIISQQEEAELFFKAVLGDFETDDDYILADVGGGSVQILIGNKNKLKQSFLLKTGTSTLWDKFTPNHDGNDFPNDNEIKNMREYILTQLQPIPTDIKIPIVFGSSCIIDLFRGIRLPLQEHKNSKSHPFKTELVDVENFLDQVWSIPYDIRETKYNSPTEKYMWGIDKGFLNIVELARKTNATYIIPSNANINQGLMMSIID